MHNMSLKITVAAVLLFPFFVFAQSSDKDSVQGYLVLITNFIGDTLLPFLFALALLFFLVNVARYFIAGGDDSESQETAKKLAIYGIGAFVFLISIWGIVNMFVSALEIDDTEANCPDYLGDWCGSSGNYGNSGGGFQRFGNFDNDDYSSSGQYIETFDDDGNLVDVQPLEIYTDDENSQTLKVYNKDGNLVSQSEINVIQDDTNIGEDEIDEPEEEVGVHGEEESAPVNIGDTNTTKCFVFNGKEVCD